MVLTTLDGRVVSTDIELADTFLKQAVGLMFRKSFDGAMVFDMGRETLEGIHMLFVRFPIDVLFLDGERMIIGFKGNVRPWTGTAYPGVPFRYAIELPAGTVNKFGLKPGEILSW